SGDLDESKPLFTEALGIARQIDDRVAQIYLLGALSCRAAASGEPRLAARLLGATESVRAEVGAIVNVVGPQLAQATESAAAALGPARFDAEVRAGARYSREAAIGLALGEPTSAAVEAGRGGAGGGGAGAGGKGRGGGRRVGRRGPEQQADRHPPVHIQAHGGEPRSRHPEQARLQLPRADRGLDGVAKPVAN